MSRTYGSESKSSAWVVPSSCESGDCGHDHERGVRGFRMSHEIQGQRGRHRQHQGAENGPVTAAEPCGGEGIGQAQHRTHQSRHGHQEELPGGIDVVDVLRHEQHHHRPDGPHRESDVFGHHGPDQVAARDFRATVVPRDDVLGIPVLNPASAPCNWGCCRVVRHTSTVGKACCRGAAADDRAITSRSLSLSGGGEQSDHVTSTTWSDARYSVSRTSAAVRANPGKD